MLMLNYFFAQYGKKFVRELTDKVRRRIGLDGVAYSSISRFTAQGQTQIKQVRHTKGNLKKNGIKQTTFTFKEVSRPLDSRLNNTMQFRENAFVSDSSDFGLTVSVNDVPYPAPEGGRSVSYEDIVAYNDKNSEEVNPNIRGGKDPHDAPSIFPMGPNAQELVEGLETYREMGEELERVVQIQLADSVKDLDIHTKIVIGG